MDVAAGDALGPPAPLPPPPPSQLLAKGSNAKFSKYSSQAAPESHHYWSPAHQIHYLTRTTTRATVANLFHRTEGVTPRSASKNRSVGLLEGHRSRLKVAERSPKN